MTLSKKGTQIPIKRPGESPMRRDEEALRRHEEARRRANGSAHCAGAESEGAARASSEAAASNHATGQTDVDWRDVAMRLKAEMDNYRKRQKRWAEDEVEHEKARLLRKFLEVVDNLEYALNHLDPQDPAHQGVQLAYEGILSLLLREGVERIFAQGRPFDPNRHEAVAVVPANRGQVEDMRVVEVMSPGYQYGGRVLRPAKVVVAKQGD